MHELSVLHCLTVHEEHLPSQFRVGVSLFLAITALWREAQGGDCHYVRMMLHTHSQTQCQATGEIQTSFLYPDSNHAIDS